MSGHSKWSTIKRQKDASDIKRGQMFTKLANAITVAVRAGGGTTDPASNFRLRLAIDAARSTNMPKDNIDRAIDRASGRQGGMVEEAVYEGFGPGGFAVVAYAATDNKQRTVSQVKNVFEKYGGRLATPGACTYLFQQKGLIAVDKGNKTLDEIFLAAADSGAEDLKEAGDEVLVYTKPESLHHVQEALGRQGLPIVAAELTLTPQVIVKITDKDMTQRALDFMYKLEELDDIQKAYANFDIPDK